MAYKLYRIALSAKHDCILNFKIDNEERRVTVSANLWAVMRGNAAEHQSPTCTIEFDFDWPDIAREIWAATLLQARWRTFKARNLIRKIKGAITVSL